MGESQLKKKKEIVHSFRLVLRGKTGKEIAESSRLDFLEKTSANNFALSDAEDNTLRPLNREDIADLPLLRTLLVIYQVTTAKFLESNRFFRFISICNFGSLKSHFPTITSLSELCFRHRRSILLLVQTKMVISINYGSSTST